MPLVTFSPVNPYSFNPSFGFLCVTKLSLLPSSHSGAFCCTSTDQNPGKDFGGNVYQNRYSLILHTYAREFSTRVHDFCIEPTVSYIGTLISFLFWEFPLWEFIFYILLGLSINIAIEPNHKGQPYYWRTVFSGHTYARKYLLQFDRYPHESTYLTPKYRTDGDGLYPSDILAMRNFSLIKSSTTLSRLVKLFNVAHGNV